MNYLNFYQQWSPDPAAPPLLLESLGGSADESPPRDRQDDLNTSHPLSRDAEERKDNS